MNYSEYKNLKIGKEEAKEVTEQDIVAQLDSLLNQAISYEEKDGLSENGDIVNIDFEGFVDDVAFEGGKGEKYDLTLGSGTFIPGFEEQLVGKNKGDHVDVKVTFPEEYHAENLKGKEAVFKCIINEIKQKKVPTLDDEFAISQGYESLEGLKKACFVHLDEENKIAAINAYMAKICDYLADHSEFDLDQEELNKRIDEIINYYENMISQYGVTLETYLQMSNLTLEAFREKLLPDAVKSLKIDMVYAYIAEKENLLANEEEFKNHLSLIKNHYNLTEEQLTELENNRKNDLLGEITRQKVSQFLYKNND